MRALILQHGLPSIAGLLDDLITHFGFNDVSLFVKSYSKMPIILDRFSPLVIDGPQRFPIVPAHGEVTVVLDEGGWLHDAVPAPAVGVEQTTAGLRDHWRYPVVLLCRSAAKMIFESQIIARGIIRKLDALELIDGKAVCVVGLGALGSELHRQLQERGVRVEGIDRRNGACAVTTAERIGWADLVLGCTGKDALHNVDLSGISGRKVFASCSSTNIEFRSLLDCAEPHELYQNVFVNLGNAEAIVLNGGFPVNFDRQREWELPAEIILTRQLCFGAVLQAISLVGTEPRGVMLDPQMQLDATNAWLNHVPERDRLRIPTDLNLAFFSSYSEGEPQAPAKPAANSENLNVG